MYTWEFVALATHSKSLREMASIQNCDAILVRASQAAGTLESGLLNLQIYDNYFNIPTQQFGDSLYTYSYRPHSFTKMTQIIMQQTGKKLTTAWSVK